MAFLAAPTWNDWHNVLTAHSELLNVGAEMIDMILTDPVMAYPAMTRADAEATMRKHKAVLQRCKTYGLQRTLADL